MVSAKVELKEVTVREVYEAMVKNGPEWLRGTWFSADSFGIEDETTVNITGACIMGQAAYNLNVLGTLDTLTLNSGSVGTHNLYDQLNKLKVLKSNKWMQINTATGAPKGAADTIMYWNDESSESPDDFIHEKGVMRACSEYNDLHYNCEGYYPYLLETYEEVLQVAYDVLERHFDKVLKIAVINPPLSILNN